MHIGFVSVTVASRINSLHVNADGRPRTSAKNEDHEQSHDGQQKFKKRGLAPGSIQEFRK
jgi:hypothetical protein